MLFAEYNLKTTGFVAGAVYDLKQVVENANIQGVQIVTPAVAATTVLFTVGAAANSYTVSMVGPTIYTTGVQPALIACWTANRPCTSW